MPLTQPQGFSEAIDKLSQRVPTPASWDSAMWSAMKVDVRERAFFSARVENEMFLQRSRIFIKHFLERRRGPDGKIVAGSMSQFVDEMRAFADREGMGFPGPVNEKDITDIRSEARLRLIFQTNVRTSYGYGNWRQGMEPAVVYAFPAARFIRFSGAKTFRERHLQGEGDVRLKTDTAYWADWQNARAIGGFQTPWPPYGFNSFMDQQDVSREEAKRLGLLDGKKEKPRKIPGLNEKLSAAVGSLDADLKKKLREELGDLGVFSGGRVRLRARPDNIQSMRVA